MGECRFCHKDAGFLKKEHDECRRKFEDACNSALYGGIRNHSYWNSVSQQRPIFTQN